MSTLYYENEKHVYSFEIADNLFCDSDTEDVIVMSKSVETEKLESATVKFSSVESALLSVVTAEIEKRDKESLIDCVTAVAENGFTFSSFTENRLRYSYSGKVKKDTKSEITYHLTITKKIAKVNFMAIDKNSNAIFADCEMKRKIAELNEKLYNLICHVSGSISGKMYEKLLREFYGENKKFTVNGDRMHVLKGAFKMVHTCKIKNDEDGKETVKEKIQFLNKDAQKAEFCSVLLASDDIIETMKKESKK